MGLGARFCDALHIPTERRRPTRERVLALKAKVQQMPQTPDIKPLVKEMESAQAIIYKKVKTNAERKKTVDEATTKCNTVEATLQRLPPPVVTALPKPVKAPKPTKDDLARSKNLEKSIKDLETYLESLAPDFKSIIPSPGMIPHSELGLKVAALAVDMRSRVMTEAASKEVTTKIQSLRTEIDKQHEDYKTAKQRVDVIATDVALSKKSGPLKALEGLLTPEELAKTPLKQQIDKLGEMTKTGIMWFPERIEAAYGEFEKLRAEAGKDPAAYARQFKTTNQAAVSAAKMQEDFDKLVKPKLDALVKIAEPAGIIAKSPIKALTIRKSFETPAPQGQPYDVPKIAADLIGESDAETLEAQKDIAARRKAYEDLAADIEKKEKELESTKAKPQFALEWQQIGGLITAFQQRKPLADMDANGFKDLDAAVTMGKTVVERLDALIKDKGTLLAFESDLDLVKQGLAGAKVAGEDSAFAKYFPDERKKLKEGFDKLQKELPGLGAAAASKALAALKKTMEDKSKEASDAADEVEKKLNPQVAALKKIFDGANRQVANLFKSLKQTEQKYALDAYKAAAEARPIKLADVQAAFAKVEIAFKNIRTQAELVESYQIAAPDRENQEKWQSQQVEALKKKKAELVDRFAALQGGYDYAKQRVNAAKGDQNALKAAEALYKSIDQQIDAFNKNGTKQIDAAVKERVLAKGDQTALSGIESKLTGTLNELHGGIVRLLDRFSDRIDLMTARPEGQKGAKLKDLPRLVQAWETTRTTTAVELGTLETELKGYDPGSASNADEIRNGVAALCGQIQQYAALVTAPAPAIVKCVDKLMDDEGATDAERRAEREAALAAIADRQRTIQGHPLSAMLAACPFKPARTVPARLSSALTRLEFTVLTSVAA